MGAVLRVALAQHLIHCDPATIIAEARRAGADIVVFPEMYSNGCTFPDPADSAANERWRNAAQRPDGEFVQQFREAARSHRTYVVATFLETGDPKPFNSALLIGPKGETVLHHRKVQVCDFQGGAEGMCGRGNQFCTGEIAMDGGTARVGLMICMDREYPESARELSRAGAEVILVPNCCDLATDPQVGNVRIAQARGRAFEMVTGIAVSNYPAPRCDGHSFAADPTGTLIAMADDSPGVTIAAFDLSLIREARAKDHFRWRV
jgi:deaminated glutathione amidase